MTLAPVTHRLRNIKRHLARRVFPFAEVLPDAYLATAAAFPFSYSIGRLLVQTVHSLSLSENSKILIVGAQGGRDYFWLRGFGFQPDLLDLGHHDFARTTAVGDACSAETWQSLPGGYDLVVMCDVLEHLPEDYKALKFARNSLSSSGRIFLSVPFQHDPEPTHVRSYTRTTLVRLLSAAGLRVEWFRRRPGIVEAYPRIVNAINYGMAAAMPTSALGAAVLERLLDLEFALNDRSRALYAMYGRSPQRGGVLLCSPDDASDYRLINREAFIPNG